MPDIEITEETLSDIAKRILQEEDRNMFEDVAKTIRAKANRSAYIMIWLTCAESLKRKLQWAAYKDNQAGKLLGEIEDAEKKHHAVDSKLVNACRKVGAISDVEATRLLQIYENRNIYGHPYNIAPDQASILSALNTVVDAVLAKPNTLRHAYAEERLRFLTQDETYLEDDPVKVSDYAVLVADKMDCNVHRFFIMKYLIAIDKIWGDPEQKILRRRGRCFCKTFLEHVGPNSVIEANEWHDLMAKMPRLVSWLAVWGPIFKCLDDVSKDEAVLKNIEFSKSEPRRLNLLYRLLAEGLLNENQQTHFADKCRGLSAYDLSKTEIPLTYLIDAALRRLNSTDFNVANAGATLLFWMKANELVTLSTEQQDEVGKSLAKAALRNAFDAISAVRRIAEVDINVPYDLKFGYCECFFSKLALLAFQRETLYGDSIKILQSLSDNDIVAINDNFMRCLQADASFATALSSDEGKKFLSNYERVVDSRRQ